VREETRLNLGLPCIGTGALLALGGAYAWLEQLPTRQALVVIVSGLLLAFAGLAVVWPTLEAPPDDRPK
jgi:uncharacterized membrane protein YccC